MMLGERAIGALWLGRDFKGAFGDKELALLKTFTEQAVIALQNSRLFNETREALEQQKASGEVLAAISSSIADTGPVFEKILASCVQLFAGTGSRSTSSTTRAPPAHAPTTGRAGTSSRTCSRARRCRPGPPRPARIAARRIRPTRRRPDGRSRSAPSSTCPTSRTRPTCPPARAGSARPPASRR